MPVVYDFRQSTVTLTAATGLTGIRAFLSNPNRVSLIIASNAQNIAGGTSHVSISTSQKQGSFWFDNTPPVDMRLTYRDFGPILRQEVWVFATTTATIDVYCTEIFRTY